MVLAIANSGFGQNTRPLAPAGPNLQSKRQTDNYWWGHQSRRKDKSRRQTQEENNSLGLPLLKHIAQDQKAIWTSPAHLHPSDANWLVPLAGAAAAMFATDTSVSRHLSNSPTRIDDSRQFSDVGLDSLIGLAGGMYLWGKARHNKHMQETGLLSGEAAIDTLIDGSAVKYAAGRERPFADNARGRFEQGGASFPSGHAAGAWSIAGVIAHEYPGPLTKLFAYGLASAIGISRVTGKEHFPSDVLVGSALGYLISQQVYRSHHDPRLPGGAWNMPLADSGAQDGGHNPGAMGSPYVPLDSWIYPALERLAAVGYINTDFLGLRPWTRLECARLVQEAQDHLEGSGSDNPQAHQTVEALEQEFANDLDLRAGERNRGVRVKSVYTRVTDIAGKPLEDGYHFAQTRINDFGRPYAEGFNNITGFSGWGASGHFVGYVRGEYQYAPSIPAPPLFARQVISYVDHQIPLEPATGTPAVSRFDWLNAYVGMNFGNWQFSFGKQSLWWGPGEGGAMLFSDNAEPVEMFRVDRVSPLKLPSILGLLGPVRTQFFIGQLGGHQFIFGAPTGLQGNWGTPLSDQPMIHGEKFSFKPTRNLEFSVSRTALFAGAGVPFTAKTFLRSMFSLQNGISGCYQYSAICPRLDPGDRRSAVDFNYRVPKLRKWLTWYSDGFTEDQFSPIGYADRSVWETGIYMPRLPKLHNFDFRAEGVYTDNPLGGNLSFGYFYFNDRYRNGYTNDGNLLASWIGRQGKGAQAWTSYWLSPRSRIRLGYRHQQVSQQFIPFGGTLNDASVDAELWAGRDMSVSGTVQYEKWNFKALAPTPQSNVTTAIQLTFWPEKWNLR